MWNLLRIKKISKSATEMKVTERNVAHIKLQFASHLEHIPSALYCTFRQCWIWKLFLFKSICQPKKALSIIQSATSIKLLHVPAPWSHSQEVWAQRNISLTWHTPHPPSGRDPLGSRDRCLIWNFPHRAFLHSVTSVYSNQIHTLYSAKKNL